MVQGVTEVLPVSSSAHLALLPDLLGWQQPPDRTAFAAALHAGSTAGLLWALRDSLSLRELAVAGVSAVPAAVAGLAGADAVEARLGGPLPTAALLAGAGLLMALADRRPADRPVSAAALTAASLVQVAALAPGVSRSGASLTALRLLRVERQAAVRQSLLMSLPITVGAAGLTLARTETAVVRRMAPALALGLPAAAAAAALAVRHAPERLAVPAVYRLALAAAIWGRTAVRHSRGST